MIVFVLLPSPLSILIFQGGDEAHHGEVRKEVTWEDHKLMKMLD